MYKKPVIVFEGIEGSGKTFHINHLSKYLKKKKIDHIKIREPGGTTHSEQIRRLILNNKSNFDKKTDLLLYLASRNENIIKLKKYYKKKIILIDRFSDSTISYQHYGFNLDLKLINIINNNILENFKVDFTFLNIVNNKNMIKRLRLRKKLNRYDKFNNKFYTKVQKGFIKLANRKKRKYLLVDSNSDINKNKELIIKKFNEIIK
tara:strand:- start:1326 stop:1940 length:615 start_codon:yes stop_codon:yes gene_type:complete